MKHAIVIAFAALAFTPAGIAAEETVSARAAASLGPILGQWIANQGNAALIEIREEMKKDLLERLEPYLPALDERAGAAQPQTNSDPAL